MDRHSLQSPFIYDLYTKVIRPKGKGIGFPEIEKQRGKLKENDRLIAVTDYGAGSNVDNSNRRKISDIAVKGISPLKYSEMFVRLANYLKAKNIVELGTSIGINTMYLASVDNARVTTFEGAESLAKEASNLFESSHRSNVKIVQGNIDLTLPKYLDDVNQLDLVYFDANHRYEPTVRYFKWCKKHAHDTSCFILDDIHWSKEMDKAWKEIHKQEDITLSIDLFQVGLIFFNPELTKQHYVLEF